MHNSLSSLLSRSKNSKHVILRRLSRQRRDASMMPRTTALHTTRQWQDTTRIRSRPCHCYRAFTAVPSNHDDDDDLFLDDEIEALAASFLPVDEYGSEGEDLKALRKQRLCNVDQIDLELGETSVWDFSEDDEDELEPEISNTVENPLELPFFPEGSPAAERQRQKKRKQQLNGTHQNQQKHEPMSPLDLLEQLSLHPSETEGTRAAAQQDPLSYMGPDVAEDDIVNDESDMQRVQLRLECEAQREAVEKYQRLTEQTRSRKDFASLSTLQRLVLNWYQPIRDEISSVQNDYLMRRVKIGGKKKKKEPHKPHASPEPGIQRYGPKLNAVEAEKLAVLVTHEIITTCLGKASETNNRHGGQPVVGLALQLGRAVEQEVLLQRILKKTMDQERADKSQREAAKTNPQVAALAAETLMKSVQESADGMQPWSYAESRLTSYLQDISFDGKKVTSKNRRNIAYAVRQARRALAAEDWETSDLVQIGSILLKIVLEHATIRLPDGTVQPAFRMEKKWAFYSPKKKKRRFKSTNYIMVHDALFKLAVSDEFESIAATTTRHKPMVVPPQPWTSPAQGGYLWLKTDLIRFHGSQMQREALDEADLTNVFDGLNALSREPWVINETILKVADECWNKNISLGDIPSRTDLKVPSEPSPPPKTSFANEGDPEYDEERIAAQKKAWSNQYKAYQEQRNRYERVKQKNRDMFSLRCSATLKLGQAKQFKEYEKIYFPYNMDFRGRAYPVPPHLSNVGSDLCRGMLKFAKAKPLGKRGLYWLQVHLANLAGKDKMTFDDRAQYTIDNMEHVRAAVADPFGQESNLSEGERPWWMGLDDPFQGLATCHEIVNAIDSGNPETYMCALPVHMDGSCNGLQHYAALGLDTVGGTAVNLCDYPEPQDVYIGVMEEVIKRVADEAAIDLDIDDDPESLEKLTKKEKKALKRNQSAKLVNGLIDRGVVKRTVMTSVYGVTYIGARQQIQEKIEEKLEEQGRDLDEINWAVFAASGYLAEVTMNVIGDLFTGAKETMNWLTQCARLISSKGYPVAWMTPLGLPALQPYRQKRSYRIVTCFKSITIADFSDDLPIHKSRSVSAFPPNYIHSLDSTHMLMTALEMDRRGLSFSAVHDSFWTHACDIDEMNEALREQFVDLYSQPLLEELKQSFELRYPDINFPDLPEKGDLELSEVKKATFFFQ